jgi:hypothetical protein
MMAVTAVTKKRMLRHNSLFLSLRHSISCVAIYILLGSLQESSVSYGAVLELYVVMLYPT